MRASESVFDGIDFRSVNLPQSLTPHHEFTKESRQNNARRNLAGLGDSPGWFIVWLTRAIQAGGGRSLHSDSQKNRKCSLQPMCRADSGHELEIRSNDFTAISATDGPPNLCIDTRFDGL